MANRGKAQKQANEAGFSHGYYLKLKMAFEHAIDKGKTIFIYKDEEYLVSHAKYLIYYYELRMAAEKKKRKLIKDNFKKS